MLLFDRRAALTLPLFAAIPSFAWAAADADNTVILTTKYGKTVIRLRPTGRRSMSRRSRRW